MKPQDLLTLRETFDRNAILLSFNGPFSASLIEEIGMALRRHLEALDASPSSVSDVFSIYIELTQNIRHYAREKQLPETMASGTIVISRGADGHYEICAGNMVHNADGEALCERVAQFASMDKTALKTAYKTQLRAPRETGATTGAGLGLIDIARKAHQAPLACLQKLDEQFGFFSLQVTL